MKMRVTWVDTLGPGLVGSCRCLADRRALCRRAQVVCVAPPPEPRRGCRHLDPCHCPMPSPPARPHSSLSWAHPPACGGGPLASRPCVEGVHACTRMCIFVCVCVRGHAYVCARAHACTHAWLVGWLFGGESTLASFSATLSRDPRASMRAHMHTLVDFSATWNRDPRRLGLSLLKKGVSASSSSLNASASQVNLNQVKSSPAKPSPVQYSAVQSSPIQARSSQA